MKTEPNCAKCGKYLGEEKEEHLARMNRCGLFPKPYCAECFKEVPKVYRKPMTKKSFAKG